MDGDKTATGGNLKKENDMPINNQSIRWLDPNARTLKLTIAWTSSAGGAVSEAISAANMTIILGKNLAHFITDPGATAPTDNYDLTLLDAYGVDVLGGEGANRDTANSEQSVPALKSGVYGDRIMDTALIFTIAAAGDTKQGTVILYFRW